MHVVEAAKVYETVEEAIGDLTFVLATTARPRDMIKTVRGPVEAAEDLRRRFSSGEKTGILFGRERWGLNNDEIILATRSSPFRSIPALCLAEHCPGRFADVV